jgi:release factor glutamine methyltransferase
MEKVIERKGNNLYPSNLKVKFGNYDLDLDVPAGVWNPTPHGIHLGNMLAKIDFTGKHVLELGTGCGLHAIVIAEQGAAKLTLTEIDEPILKNARHNLKKYGCDLPVAYIVADWTNLEGEKYDVLVTNPPFTKSGKIYRRYFIDTLILNAHKLLKPGGELIFIHSSMANIPRSIKMMEENGMEVEIIGETSGPFRQYYFEDAKYMKDIASIPNGYTMIDGKHYERLMVFRATLKPNENC